MVRGASWERGKFEERFEVFGSEWTGLWRRDSAQAQGGGWGNGIGRNYKEVGFRLVQGLEIFLSSDNKKHLKIKQAPKCDLPFL